MLEEVSEEVKYISLLPKSKVCDEGAVVEKQFTAYSRS